MIMHKAMIRLVNLLVIGLIHPVIDQRIDSPMFNSYLITQNDSPPKTGKWADGGGERRAATGGDGRRRPVAASGGRLGGRRPKGTYISHGVAVTRK